MDQDLLNEWSKEIGALILSKYSRHSSSVENQSENSLKFFGYSGFSFPDMNPIAISGRHLSQSARQVTLSYENHPSRVARKLPDYLDGKIPGEALVGWAESAMMEGIFPPEDAETLAQVAARLGLADVRAFGLTWQDCQEIFHNLGLTAKIDLVAA